MVVDTARPLEVEVVGWKGVVVVAAGVAKGTELLGRQRDRSRSSQESWQTDRMALRENKKKKREESDAKKGNLKGFFSPSLFVFSLTRFSFSFSFSSASPLLLLFFSSLIRNVLLFLASSAPYVGAVAAETAAAADRSFAAAAAALAVHRAETSQTDL